MRTAALVLLAFGLSVVPVSAQTGAPTSWVLRIYVQGSATPLSTFTVSVSQVACNQAAATGSSENPTTWRWDDIANAGRQCAYSDSRFSGLPDGSYEGTAQALNADGSSAETARVPFTRRRSNPPAVPTGLLFTR
jgi:hypothetical protein